MQNYDYIRPARGDDAGRLLDCYNSANQLHKPEVRADGELETFKQIVKTDHVFLIEDQEIVLGWISYKVLSVYLLVTGLYVRKENQRVGIAQRLLNFAIDGTSGLGLSLCFLKVLKNAPWAISFYQKNGFVLLESDSDDPVMQREAELMVERTGFTKSKWSYFLYKKLKLEETTLLGHRGFDLWADGYDKDVRIGEESDTYPFAGYQRVLNTVYGIVRGRVGNVLDIGFGTGILTRRLYDDGYVITGIDFSKRMMEIAKEKMPQANLIQWDFTKGLPKILDASFDWIISTYAIHHLTDDQKKPLFLELMGYLKPGGAIVFGDVAFQSLRELEDARTKDHELWDEAEEYLVADEIKGIFPDWQVDFLKMSYCSGVLVIKK